MGGRSTISMNCEASYGMLDYRLSLFYFANINERHKFTMFSSEMLKSMTKSHMSVIRNLKIKIRFLRDLPYLWRFINSKPTLKSIRFTFWERIAIPFEYWKQLVDILEKTRTPKRPVLKMSIISDPIGDDVVRSITSTDSNIFFNAISFFHCSGSCLKCRLMNFRMTIGKLKFIKT